MQWINRLPWNAVLSVGRGHKACILKNDWQGKEEEKIWGGEPHKEQLIVSHVRSLEFQAFPSTCCISVLSSGNIHMHILG